MAVRAVRPVGLARFGDAEPFGRLLPERPAVRRGSELRDECSRSLPRIAFFFNAQAHQLLHGVTIAEELALGWQAQVDILSSTRINLDLGRAAIPADHQRLLRFEQVGSRLARSLAARMGRVVPPKMLTLLAARRLLNGYDAIALPERTSIALRSMGVTRPRFIHIDHGAGDRAAGYDRRIARFDFALMAGDKQRRRMLAEGLVRDGAYAIVGYPKFDAADRLRDEAWSPFAVERPIILYNPHFSPTLGSWAKHGFGIVRAIVESGRYNLVIAPHIRLCDSRRGRAAAQAIFGPFARFPQVHLDLGSERSIDMTYTSLADVYLGDVSSQIYEFLRRPRPCLFVNSDGRPWEGDRNHDHWRFGPVTDGATSVLSAIERAIATHGDYASVQRQAFLDTFDFHGPECASRRAAGAIAAFLGLSKQS